MEAETNVSIKYIDFINSANLLKMICNSSYLEKENAHDPFSAVTLAAKLKMRKHFKNWYRIS